MEQSAATDDEFLESLRADVARAVTSRVAARLLVADGDDDAKSRGDALLAAVANDFPFLYVAWDRDPARLRALASSAPSGAAVLGARSPESANANVDCGGGAQLVAEKASAAGVSGRASSGGGRRSGGETSGSSAEATSPETRRVSSSTTERDLEQRGASGRTRACKSSRPPPPLAAKRKRKAKASKIVRYGGDRDDDYIPDDDGNDDDHMLSAKKPKKLNRMDRCRQFNDTSAEGRKTKYPDNRLGVYTKAWLEKMDQCRKFKEEHGHLIIPKSHPELGTWAHSMSRHQRKLREGEGDESAEELSAGMQDKLRQLNDIGFSLETSFDRKLREFLAFKQLNGHGNVLLSHPSLGNWVGRVRREWNRMGRGGVESPTEKSAIHLTPDRMRRLTEAGFVFRAKPPDIPWEVRIAQLRKFKEENGHLRIPGRHPVLGTYARNLRQQYRGTKPYGITPERRKELDEIGFYCGNVEGTPTPHKDRGRKKTWDERFEDFKAFRAKHGHPYVPAVGDGSDEAVRLGRWVANQRQMYRYTKQGIKVGGRGAALSTEKALKLSEAGFAWDASHIRRTPKDDSSSFGR